MSQKSLRETAPGKLVNLLSNDVNRFDTVAGMHQLWTAPLATIVGGYILWAEIRWAGMIGIVVVFLFAVFQSMISDAYHSSSILDIIYNFS